VTRILGIDPGSQRTGVGVIDVDEAGRCTFVHAEALVLLTVVQGLLDASGHRVDLVRDLEEARGLDRKDKSRLGSGGMTSKLEAARLVTNSGHAVVIANGREPEVLPRLFEGEPLGTVFAPAPKRLASRARWIGLTTRPAGAMRVDDGAVAALTQRGKSLLASGIVGIDGRFDRGAVVAIHDARGQEIARGLTNYSAEEVRRIMGMKSAQFEKALGRPAYAEVVHRDNLVLVGG
jgi:glutamate 5-kinase